MDSNIKRKIKFDNDNNYDFLIINLKNKQHS